MLHLLMFISKLHKQGWLSCPAVQHLLQNIHVTQSMHMQCHVTHVFFVSWCDCTHRYILTEALADAAHAQDQSLLHSSQQMRRTKKRVANIHIYVHSRCLTKQMSKVAKQNISLNKRVCISHIGYTALVHSTNRDSHHPGCSTILPAMAVAITFHANTAVAHDPTVSTVLQASCSHAIFLLAITTQHASHQAASPVEQECKRNAHQPSYLGPDALSQSCWLGPRASSVSYSLIDYGAHGM